MATRTAKECSRAGCHRTTMFKYCDRCEAAVTAQKKADARFYASEEWRQIKSAVDRRDGELCAMCSSKGVHYDHVVPRVRGGADHPRNVRKLCHPHHSQVTRLMQNEGLL